MNPSLVFNILAVIAAAVVIWLCVRTSRSNRATKAALAETQAAIEEQKARENAAEDRKFRTMALISALTGQVPIEPVNVADIKHRDKVCWHSLDGSRHEHYVAGYDGDPGPSADGIHARPIVPKGL